MKAKLSDPPKQIAIVTFSLAITYCAGLLLDSILGREYPFLFYLLAVLVCARYAGFRASLAATFISTGLILRYLFHHSVHSSLIDELLPPAIFCLIAIFSSWTIVAHQKLLHAALRSNDELQRKTEELRRSEERYRTAAMVSRDVLWDWTLPLDRVEWTEGMSRVFGYKPQEIGRESRWWQNRIHADDRDRVLSGLQRAISSATNWNDEFRFRRADGQFAMVINRALILRDPDGTAVRMIGSMLDLSRQKQAEKTLRESQRFLQRLLRNVPSPIVLLDFKGRIVQFNRACEQMSGYRRREVLGKTIPDCLLPPEDVPLYEKRFADPFAPEACETHELHWRTKTGEMRLLEWRFTLIPSPDGSTPYLLGAASASAVSMVA